jgi:Prolyl oligopeptidase family
MRKVLLSFAVLLCGSLAFGQARPLAESKRQSLADDLAALEKKITISRDTVDAAIFAKGLAWALKYDGEFTPADAALLENGILRGNERATAAAAKTYPWKARRGKVALGYRSRIDGSVQPYGLIIPKDYDPAKPMRLDVVLHGSTRPMGISELRFMARFDEGDGENPSPPEAPFIELHPLGRVENCYRWAGETDVFEAIADVRKRYSIDKDRIVLRGMSMGASGTWHLGLKHPDFFVALGPYCGYVDTHKFSETPLDNFVKIGLLPEHQELGLHMLDSVDYAANAGIVPAIACMGEKDIFFQAHVIMGEAMRKEGLTMVNLISPGTGHVIDPVTHAEQMKRIGVYADKGIDRQPTELRFVTWTLKYSRCHWLQVLGLEKHYSRAEISARRKDDVVEIDESKNITRFAIMTGDLPRLPKLIRVGQTELMLPASITEKTSPGIVLARRGAAWEVAGELGRIPLSGKRPGITGPIDDAFTEPFLVVHGTGKPWNDSVNNYALESRNRFAEEWRHYFRGQVPIKADTEVTPEDVRSKNLILFGDPGSNSWIAKTLPKLPLKWTPEKLTLGGHDYPAANHVPALIAPSPLPGGEQRYIVLNSGHTFRAAELSKVNYLLFPRWGDWAVLRIDPKRDAAPHAEEQVLRAGYFDEDFR